MAQPLQPVPHTTEAEARAEFLHRQALELIDVAMDIASGDANRAKNIFHAAMPLLTAEVDYQRRSGQR